MFTEMPIETLPASIHTEIAHPSRSESYRHVPTKEIVQMMRADGFVPVNALETKVRKEHKRGFQKHFLRMRHKDALFGEFGTVAEILFRNSHDGSGGIHFFAGMLRGFCQNGVIVADAEFTSISIPHRGDFLRERIKDAAFEAISVSNRAQESIATWSKIALSSDQQMKFARRALELRFENLDESPIRPEALLLTRRQEDIGPDLWHVFNRVQENLIRGGLVGMNKRDEKGNPLARTLRGIRGAQRNISLNSDLWRMADEIAQAA